MRFSKFAHIYEAIYEDSSNFIIRHSITNKSFFLNEKEIKLLIKNLKKGKKDENINNLIREHILVENNYSEEKFVNYLKKINNLNKFDLEIIYLIFNTECNLKCKYCYVEGSTSPEFKHNSMSKKIFNNLIVYLDNLIKYQKNKNPDKKKLTFIYYGSEPLISKLLFIQSLKKIQKICNKNKITPNFQLITNGILLDSNLAEILKKFRVIVSISLDGSKEVNDLMRITKNNQGTYEKVIASIKLLNKYKISFGISCTIGDHNINLLNENVNHFMKLGAKSIGFNIPLNAKYLKMPNTNLIKLNDKLLEASAKANNIGFYEDRIQRKVKAFNGKPRFKDCGGVGNQLVFFPNGDIGVCEGYLCNRKYVIGNIKSQKIKDIEKSSIVKYWTKRYPLNMKECIYCPFLGICGGGCPFNAETISNKSIYERDKSFCVHTEKSLNWLLKKAIEEKTNKKDPYIRDASFMFSQNFS